MSGLLPWFRRWHLRGRPPAPPAPTTWRRVAPGAAVFWRDCTLEEIGTWEALERDDQRSSWLYGPRDPWRRPARWQW